MSDDGNISNNNNDELNATYRDKVLIRRRNLDRVRNRQLQVCLQRNETPNVTSNDLTEFSGNESVLPFSASKPVAAAAAAQPSKCIQPIIAPDRSPRSQSTSRRPAVRGSFSPAGTAPERPLTSPPEDTNPIAHAEAAQPRRTPSSRLRRQPRGRASASPLGGSMSSAPMTSQGSAECRCCRNNLPQRCCRDGQNISSPERHPCTSRDRSSSGRVCRREKMHLAMKWLSDCAGVRCEGTTNSAVDGCLEPGIASSEERPKTLQRDSRTNHNAENNVGNDDHIYNDCLSKALEVFRYSLRDGDELLRLGGEEGDGILHYDLLSFR